MIGLKRGEVVLCDHQKDWEEAAKVIILKLKEVFGKTAVDIQHVGSTSIHNIKAKPMIDIAVGVASFDNLDDIFINLEKIGVYKSPKQPLMDDILCAVKNSRESDTCLCTVHIEIINSIQWNNHIVFRNYMNDFPEKAKEYEALKVKLAEEYPHDREAYLRGKKEFIASMLLEAEKAIE